MTGIITCRMLSFKTANFIGSKRGNIGQKNQKTVVGDDSARLLTLMRNVAKAADEESYQQSATTSQRKRFMGCAIRNYMGQYLACHKRR